MSFSEEVKREIIKFKPYSSKTYGAFSYGKKIFGNESIGELMIDKTMVSDENLNAFIAGAFLSCGSISEPKAGYHMEFCPPSGFLSDFLFELLSNIGYPPKSSFRRNRVVLYYKESEQIEDILTMIGASTASLSIMETKIFKDYRNRANRASNCEIANIDKTLKSSKKQMDDIDYLKDNNLIDTLPPQIEELVALRIQNPDASLSDLAETLGVSRSGINHRFIKLHKICEEYRKKI